jgi:multiple sugar transport system substrate-binding protein
MHEDGDIRRLTRRHFLKVGGGALAGAYALGLAGCGGGGQASGELTFFSWNIESDLRSFRELINKYEKQHPDVSINLQTVPEGNFDEWFGTRLAAGKAPDIQRMTWQSIGRYSSQGALVDFSQYVDEGYSDAFEPVFWRAVSYEDKPYALPHHTDTFAVYYNTDYFDKLGVDIPQKGPQSGWSWDQFIDVARQVKDETDAEYAFAFGFQGPNTGYRWLPFLYQNGGQLLNENMDSPQITDQAGIDAIAWTQSWFEEKLIPAGSTIKATDSTGVTNLFATGNIGMMIHGDWMMPYLEDNMKDFDWDVTYMVRNAEMASDLGGNCLAITKDSQNPELAADFIKFVVNEENMRYFCRNSQFLPIRKSLIEQGIDYSYRPDAMQKFLEQAKTIPAHMAGVETHPAFNQINAVLEDQLELAFTLQQEPEKTAQNIGNGIKEVLSE